MKAGLIWGLVVVVMWGSAFALTPSTANADTYSGCKPPATGIILGQPHHGNICPVAGQIDVLYIRLDQGQAYRIYLGSDDGSFQPYMLLMTCCDTDGTPLQYGNVNNSIWYRANYTGLHAIRVGSTNGSIGRYWLSVNPS